VSPTADVGKALSAAATGLTGAEAAYDEKILLSQSIQNLETEMRADRSAQGAVILANMRCPLGQYNLGMALSDLEEYYRAGTLPSAMIALSKTVANAENVAKATKASMNPAPRVAQAGLDRTDQAHSIDTQPLAVQDGNGCSQGSADVGVIPFPKAHPRKSAAAPETCETLGSELVADQSRLADPVIRNRMRDVALKRRKMGCPAISVG
jgi:hypothetical protein